MTADERLRRADELYQRAVFGGDAAALGDADHALDGVEADLALARGRVAHARFLADRVEDPGELALFERAAGLYRGLGDGRGEAEALFWTATFHQVVRGDHETALPMLERARVLPADRLTTSYVLRHLCFAAQAGGRVDEARELLTESTRLRRELGFHAGVAANLVGLAYLSEDDDEATAHLDEAEALATAHGAAGVLAWVAEARDRDRQA